MPTPQGPSATAPMPSKQISPSANTSNPLFNCPHALKRHFTQCQHINPPFQLPQCPQNIFHTVQTPQPPFSTAPMPSKQISPSANTPNPLFNCPHALKTHYTQCQHLNPPFQLPPGPPNTFHPVPTPQTLSSTAPKPSKHISANANTSNYLFNCPHALKNIFHPMPTPQTLFSSLAWQGSCPPWWCVSVALRVCGCRFSRPPPLLAGGSVLVGRRGLALWPVPPISCTYVGGVSPSPCCFSLGGLCLFHHLPSLGRCMHWLVNGVTNWLAYRAVPCRCVVRGLVLCPGSVRRAAYVHVWAGGPSCWVRSCLIRLGGCASWPHGARRVGGGGAAGVFLLGWGCPIFPFPCGAGVVSAGLSLLWPVAISASGPLRAGKGQGCVRSFRSCDRRPCWGGGGGVVPSGVWWSPSLGPCGSEG